MWWYGITTRDIIHCEKIEKLECCRTCVTLTLDLPEWNLKTAHIHVGLLIKEKNCAKLFRNPSTNIEVMVPINLDGWTYTGTNIRTLREWKFQMALLLIKENSWARFFWNPSKNIEVMVQKNSEGQTPPNYKHFIPHFDAVKIYSCEKTL